MVSVKELSNYIENIDYNLPKEIIFRRLYAYLKQHKIKDEKFYYIMLNNEKFKSFIENLITKDLTKEEIDYLKDKSYLRDIICNYADLNDFENENIVKIRSKRIHNLKDYYKSMKTYEITDEKEFYKLVESGDVEAKKKFILNNISLIIDIVYKFIKDKNLNYDYFDDLFQESIITIYKNIKNIDFNRNISTYLYIAINGGLNRYMMDEILPVKSSYKDRRTYNFNYLSSKQVPIESVENIEAVDYIQKIENDIDILTLYECMQCLTKRQKEIIEIKYGFIDEKKHTLDETGNYLGISRETVRVAEVNAIKKLKKHKNVEKLKYLKY